MRLPAVLTCTSLVFAIGAFAQPNVIPIADVFQVRYASNLNHGDSAINITNSGTTQTDHGGNVCVNVYTFDPSEEMVSCCACQVTPNALVSLSVQADLISNTLSPSTPTAVVVKLVGSLVPVSGSCNPGVIYDVTSGLRAWGTTLHALPTSPATYGVTEGGFLSSGLNEAELDHLISFCGFIQANGSGFGICKSCRAGGLSGDKQ